MPQPPRPPVRLTSWLRARWSLVAAPAALALAAAFALHARAQGPMAAPEGPEKCAPSSQGCGVAERTGTDADMGSLEGPALVEIVSEHCPACARMAPIVERINASCAAGEAEAVTRIDLDSPLGEALASKHAVRVVPTFLAVDARGEVVERRAGEQTEQQLEQLATDVTGRLCKAQAKGDATGG